MSGQMDATSLLLQRLRDAQRKLDEQQRQKSGGVPSAAAKARPRLGPGGVPSVSPATGTLVIIHGHIEDCPSQSITFPSSTAVWDMLQGKNRQQRKWLYSQELLKDMTGKGTSTGRFGDADDDGPPDALLSDTSSRTMAGMPRGGPWVVLSSSHTPADITVHMEDLRQVMILHTTPHVQSGSRSVSTVPQHHCIVMDNAGQQGIQHSREQFWVKWDPRDRSSVSAPSTGGSAREPRGGAGSVAGSSGPPTPTLSAAQHEEGGRSPVEPLMRYSRSRGADDKNVFAEDSQRRFPGELIGPLGDVFRCRGAKQL